MKASRDMVWNSRHYLAPGILWFKMPDAWYGDPMHQQRLLLSIMLGGARESDIKIKASKCSNAPVSQFHSS